VVLKRGMSFEGCGSIKVPCKRPFSSLNPHLPSIIHLFFWALHDNEELNPSVGVRYYQLNSHINYVVYIYICLLIEC